jgi:hypothetical protein
MFASVDILTWAKKTRKLNALITLRLTLPDGTSTIAVDFFGTKWSKSAPGQLFRQD